MGNRKFTNNASSKLAAGIAAGDTICTVTTGEGALFPALSGAAFFLATLESGTAIEIVKVTARATDQFTIARAQEGTNAQAFSAGATVELRWTKDAAERLPYLDEPTLQFTDAAIKVGLGVTPNTCLDIVGALSQRGMAEPALSTAGQSRIYTATSGIAKISENGGAYVNLVGAAARFKIVTSSHDLSTASGTKTIAHGVTGIPKAVILLLASSDGVASASRMSVGCSDGIAMGYVGIRSATFGDFAAGGGAVGYSVITGSAYVAWGLPTFDATNVNLPFTKTGAPTGTDAVVLLVFF